MNPCECGCGQYPSEKRYRFCHGHWAKTSQGQKRNSEVHFKDKPVDHGDGYQTIIPEFMGERILYHRMLAEKALGKKLPKTVPVHHSDGNRGQDRPLELVICQDQSYHLLLHIRMRALMACGHASWRKCEFCKQYDAPENLVLSKVIQHRLCGNAYRREWAKRKNESRAMEIGGIE